MAMFSVFVTAMAQEDVNLLTTRATSLTREYLRPSLTRIYIIDGSSEAIVGVRAMDEVAKKNLKFDDNSIENRVFVMGSFSDNVTKSMRDKQIRAEAERIIKEKKIGNQIMKIWFPVFADGSYSTEKLLERGQFAATDNDVLRQNASARQSIMNELGEKLIDRSYVIFYYVYERTESKEPAVTFIPYVYKLDFNEEVRTNFYENYFNDKNGIDQCEFPLKFITNAKGGEIKYIKDISEADDDEIFTRLRKIADFQAKVPVVSTHPVRAKIGKKEGVKKGRRYVAMENRQKNDGTIVSKRIATLRAGKVADNNTVATGNSQDLSRFFITKGRRVRRGMTLVENPDFGMSIEAQYNISEICATLSQRIFGTKGSFGYLKVGLVADEDGKLMKVRGLTEKTDENNHTTYQLEDVIVLKAGLGFGTECNFGRMFTFTPSIGGGILMPMADKPNVVYGKITNTKDSESESDKSYYVEGSLKLGFYMTRNIQLFAEAGYNINVLKDDFKFMRDLYAQEHKIDAKDPMALRLGAGIKIGF